MLNELVIEVGARAIDDKRKIGIEGALIRPDNKHRDIGILLVSGLRHGWEAYIDYFSRDIGDRWPIYVTELRRRGFEYGNLLVNDIIQIDAHLRDRLETNKIIYFVHSMGGPIAVEASRRHARQVSGYLFMATYPSYGDCFNLSPDINYENWAQHLINSKKRNWAWLSYPLRNARFSVPAHFVIADRDEVVFTGLPGVRKRFENYFKSIGSTAIIPGNHVFNKIPGKLWHYNKDYKGPLLQQAFSFVEKIIG